MDETTEQCVEAITKAIAEDLREAFDKASSKPAIEQIRDQVTKTLCGGVGVDVDPDNPDQVIITWTPPRQIILELTLGE